jgi:S-ribosylhomocysteine lyase
MTDIDHRTMHPPFLRISFRSANDAGVVVWDLRIAQPNVSHIPMPVVHSLEHFLGQDLRARSDAVAVVAPMGCQTGFYIVTIGIDSADVMHDLVASSLTKIVEAKVVPLANERECGWAENHSLIGVQRLALWLLSRRNSWSVSTSDSVVNRG